MDSKSISFYDYVSCESDCGSLDNLADYLDDELEDNDDYFDNVKRTPLRQRQKKFIEVADLHLVASKGPQVIIKIYFSVNPYQSFFLLLDIDLFVC